MSDKQPSTVKLTAKRDMITHTHAHTHNHKRLVGWLAAWLVWMMWSYFTRIKRHRDVHTESVSSFCWVFRKICYIFTSTHIHICARFAKNNNNNNNSNERERVRIHTNARYSILHVCLLFSIIFSVFYVWSVVAVAAVIVDNSQDVVHLSAHLSAVHNQIKAKNSNNNKNDNSTIICVYFYTHARQPILFLNALKHRRVDRVDVCT